MSLIYVWFLLVVFVAGEGRCKDTIGLRFTRQILLRDVGNVTLRPSFNDLATKNVRASLNLTDVLTNSFVVFPDVVIVVSLWLTGPSADVLSRMHQLNQVFDGWSSTPNATLVEKLNRLSLEELKRQPSVISFSDNCKHYEEGIGIENLGFGFNNLTLLFSMEKNPRKSLVQQLCQIFSMRDCASIKLDSVAEGGGLFFAQVTVISSNRNELLLNLVDHVRYASILSSESIHAVDCAGVRLYTRPTPPALTYAGTTASCASQYWYLIFLLLLFPCVLLVGQAFYNRGAESGRRSIREMELDIRGGVRCKGQFRPPPAGAMRERHVGPNAVQPPRQWGAAHRDPNSDWQQSAGAESERYYRVSA